MDARLVGVIRRRRFVAGHADIARDRAGLLREPGLVEPSDMEVVEHRGGPDDLADRDDTGAPDAGEPDREVVGVDDVRRVGQVGRIRRRR